MPKYNKAELEYLLFNEEPDERIFEDIEKDPQLMKLVEDILDDQEQAFSPVWESIEHLRPFSEDQLLRMFDENECDVIPDDPQLDAYRHDIWTKIQRNLERPE